nr:hypothetical protein [uncultured Rhodopila sp.]
MSTQTLIPIQAAAMLDNAATEKQFADARAFFHAKRSTPRNRALALGAEPAAQTASDQGAVQFHLIGQAPADSKYSDIMNQNADNLLSIGGLIHGYMNANFPKIDAKTLTVETWRPALDAIPCTTVSEATIKDYHKSIAGVSISGEFLSMIAKAIITDGASLLTDFSTFLAAQGDIVFSLKTEGNSYKAISVTYVNYLIDNHAGGYYDYGAIFLRQIDFLASFMEAKAACVTAQSININMKYQEWVWKVITSKIRKGGSAYQDFQGLIDAGDTAAFSNAKNFFHKPKTPQAEIKPLDPGS